MTRVSTLNASVAERLKSMFAIKGIEMDKSILLQPKAGEPTAEAAYFAAEDWWRLHGAGELSSDALEMFTRDAYVAGWSARAAAAPPVGMVSPNLLLEWAVYRWRDEVEHRPLINVHRRTLDDTWRQVIRYAGGNPDELIGPSHDSLLAQRN